MLNKLISKSKFYLTIFTLLAFIQINRHLKQKNLPRDLSILNSSLLSSFLHEWKTIFNGSKHQKLIRSEILIKTAKFMIEERQEDDKELIEFVSSLIRHPNHEKVNISSKKLDYSAYKQSIVIDNLLKSKTNGFFVEAGAYDGERMSNSLFFELNRNWTGLLIEPIPQHYKNLISKKRNVYSINACLAKNNPLIAKFKEMDAMSSRSIYMSKGLSSSIGNDYLYVPCFSLHTIMRAINKTVIDYFSLDLEGGEHDFIKTIDFSKVDIKSFSIEFGTNRNKINLFSSYLTKFGYILSSVEYLDLFFIKKDVF